MSEAWREVVEDAVVDTVERARMSVVEIDGRLRWQLVEPLTAVRAASFDDGFAEVHVRVFDARDPSSASRIAGAPPVLAVTVLALSSPLGVEPYLRFAAPSSPRRIDDPDAEPDAGIIGGARHVAGLRKRLGAGRGLLFRDTDGSTRFFVELPRRPPWVPGSGGAAEPLTPETGLARHVLSGSADAVCVYEQGALRIRYHRPSGATAYEPQPVDVVHVVIAGNAQCRIDGDEHRCIPGEVLVVRAGASHGFTHLTGDFATWEVTLAHHDERSG